MARSKVRQPHWASRIAKLNLIEGVGEHPKTDLIFILVWYFICHIPTLGLCLPNMHIL